MIANHPEPEQITLENVLLALGNPPAGTREYDFASKRRSGCPLSGAAGYVVAGDGVAFYAG